MRGSPDGDGGSIASSKASSGNGGASHKERAIVGFFAETVQLFPLFRAIGATYSSTLSYMGHAIVFLQMLSFALPTSSPHGEALGALAPIIYTTHIPFWDSTYLALSFDQYYAFFWASVVLCLAPPMLAVWILATSLTINKSAYMVQLLKHWVHLLFGPLCIPVLQSLMAVCTCSTVAQENVLHAFPAESCASVASTVALSFGIFSIIVFVLTGLLLVPTLIETKHGFESPFAKNDGLLDLFFFLWKVLSVVAFHIFRSEGEIGYLPLWTCLTGAILVLCYMLTLPYYKHATNHLFVGFLLNCCWVALISFLTHGNRVHPMLTRTDMDLVLVGVSVFPWYLVGGWLCNLRVNPAIFVDVAALVDNNLRPSRRRKKAGFTLVNDTIPDMDFPRGLPSHDMVVAGNLEILRDIEDGGMLQNEELDQARNEGNGVDTREPLLTAFLSNVYIASDVAVCTRFLGIFYRVTGWQPMIPMTYFATRIFMKGLCRWFENVTILLQYGNALLQYCERPRLALLQMDRCNRADATISQRFCAFRLSILMKIELNMRDAAYQKTCERAKKLHKECLVHQAYFWVKLLPEQVDTIQVANLMNLIASTRTQCEVEFERALGQNLTERTLLGRYASFLEHVELEADAAERLRFIVKNNADERRRSSGRRVANARAEGELLELLDDVKAKRSIGAGAQSQSGKWVVALVLLLVLGGLAGYLGLSVWAGTQVELQLRTMDAAGQARALSSEGGMLALQYLLNTSDTFSTQLEQRAALVQRSLDLSALHHSLSFGPLKPVSKESLLFLTHPFVVEHETLHYDRQQHLQATANHHSAPADTLKLTEMGQYGTAVATRFQVAAAEAVGDTTSNSYVDLVKNYNDWTPTAFNMLVRAQGGQAEETTITLLTSTIALFAFCILSLAGLYGVLALYDRRALSISASVLELFTLVPKTAVHGQSREAKDRVMQYDGAEGDEDDQVQRNTIAVKDGAADAPENVALLGEATDGAEGTDEVEHVSVLTKEFLHKDEDAAHKQRYVVTTGTIVVLSVLGVFTALGLGFSVFTLSSVNAREKGLALVHEELSSLDHQYHDMHKAHAKTVEFLQTANLATANDAAERLSATTAAIEKSLTFVLHYARADWMPTVMKTASLGRKLNDVFEHAITDAMGNASSLFTDFNERSAVLAANGTYEDRYPSSHPSEYARREVLKTETATLLKLMSASLHEFVLLLRGSLEELIVYESAIPSYTTTSIVIGCASAAFISTLPALWEVFCSGKRESIGNGLQTAVALLSLVQLLTVAFSGVLLTAHDAELQAEIQAVDLYMRVNHTKVAIAETGFDAQAFSQTHDLRFYDDYFRLLHGVQETAMYKNRSPRLDALLGEIQNIEFVSLRLTAESFGIDPDRVKEVTTNFTWDITTEPTWQSVRQLYPNEPLRYNTTSGDVLLSPFAQSMVSRYSVMSPRYQALQTEVEAYVILAAKPEQDDVDQRRSEASTQLTTLSAVAVALTGLSFFLVLTLVVAALDVSYAARSSITNKTSTAFIPFRVAMVTLTLMLIGACSISGYRTSELTKVSTTIDAATRREWLTSLCVVTGEKYAAHELPELEAKAILAQLATRLNEAKSTLYFGPDQATPLAGQSVPHDELLFGQDQNLDPQFECGYSPEASVQASDLLRRGVSSAMESFMFEVSVLQSSHAPNMTNLRLMTMPLLRSLRQSSALYTDTQIQRFQLLGVVESVLIACAIVLVLFMIWFSIMPMMRQHEREAADALLLINMIPRDVREGVPCVNEFIASEFAHLSSNNGESSQDMLATLPIISIDTVGVVLKYNSAAEELFGYPMAEVVGSKIEMLMPLETAVQHDSYLKRYRDTRVARVVGIERHVVAKHADGSSIPLSLMVNEHICETGETVYIAFIADVSAMLELQRAEKLNSAIQDRCTIPMIAIDTLGTVLRFNHAAEVCFGHAVVDIVGTNVKVIVPEEHAKYHDSYLANYLRTGVKHVIDKTLHVKGLRKSGEEFPVALSVKEISTNDGSGSTYLAFAEDTTEDLIREEANAVNDIIANLSPIPIMGIDIKGKVLKFSKAASELFGYAPAEVLGMNIKMLMPPEIADHHDGYLETYRRTGVRRVIGREAELQALRKDGSPLHLRSLIREIQHPGMPPTYVGYLTDYTAAEGMKQKAQLNKTMFAINPSPVIMMNTLGTITSINKATLLEFGYREEELVGHNVKKLTPPSIAAQHDGFLARYLKTRTSTLVGSSRRVNALRKTGEEFPIDILVEKVEDDAGEIQGYIGMAINLQNLVDNEVALEVAQTISVLCASPIIGIDAVGTVISYNQIAEDLFEWPTAEVLGSNVKMLMPAEVAVNHDGFLSAYKKTRKKTMINQTREATIQRKINGQLQVEVKILEVKLNQGKVGEGTSYSSSTSGQDSSDATGKENIESNFLALFKDVRQENAAKALIQRLNHISECSPTPLIQMDAFGVVKEFNKAASTQFGYEADHVIGRNIKMLMPPGTAKFHDTYLATYRRTGVRHVVGQVRQVVGRHRDGAEFPLEIRVTEVTGSDETDNYFIGYLRDITQDLKLREINASNSIVSLLSPTPIIAMSTNGTIISFNDAASRLFEWDSKDIIAQNIKKLMPEEIAVKHDGYLTAYAKTGEKTVIDSSRKVTGMKKNGTKFRVEIMVKEMKNEEDSASSFLGSLRDCTVDDSIEFGAKISKIMSEETTEGSLVLDSAKNISFANRGFANHCGYSETDLIGLNIQRFFPVAAVDRDFLREGDRPAALTTKEGKTLPVTLSVQSHTFKDNTSATILSVTTATNRVRSEKNAERLKRLMGGIVASTVIVSPKFATEAEYELDQWSMGEPIHFAIDHVSSTAAESFGWPDDAKDLLGEPLTTLIPKAVTGRLQELLAGVVATGREKNASRPASDFKRTPTFEGEVVSPSGDVRGFFITITEIPISTVTVSTGDQFAGPTKFLLQFEHLDALDQAASATASTAMIKDMLAGHKNSVFRINPLEVVEAVNAGGVVLFGLKKATDIVGKPLKLLIPGGVVSLYQKAKAAQSKARSDTLDLLPAAGATEESDSAVLTFPASGYVKVGEKSNTVDLVVTVAPFASESGGSTSYLVVTENITPKQEADRDIQMASAAISRCEIPIIAMDAVGTIMRWSLGSALEFGYTAEEVVGQNIKMMMPPRTAASHDGYLEAYQKTRKKNVIDGLSTQTAVRKDGSTFAVELKIRECDMGGGRKNWFVASLANVTKRQHQRANTAYANAIEFAITDDLIVVTNPTGMIVSCSEGIAQVFGHRRRDYVGKHYRCLSKDSNFVEPGQHDKVEVAPRGISDGTGSSAAAGETGSMVGSMSSKSSTASAGNPANPSNTAGASDPSKGSKGDSSKHSSQLTANAYSLSIDVTRRQIQSSELITITKIDDPRQADKKNTLSAELAALIIKQSPEALVEIDEKGTIHGFNASAELMFDFTFSQVAGKNVRVLMNESIGRQHDGYLANYLKTGKTKMIDTVTKIRAERKNGDSFEAEITIKVMRKKEMRSWNGETAATTGADVGPSSADISQDLDSLSGNQASSSGVAGGSTAESEVIIGFVAMIRDLNPPPEHVKAHHALHGGVTHKGGGNYGTSGGGQSMNYSAMQK